MASALGRAALLAGATFSSVVACDARNDTNKPVPAPAPASTKSAAPASEPALGRACSTDRDCDVSAPRCAPFAEDDYLAPRAEDAAVMHCTRPCDDVECPSGYACRREPAITSAVNGHVKGRVTRWCGKVVTLSPTPLSEIPRHAVARYFEEGLAQIPVVALYWDSGKLTVAGPGFVQSFSSEKEAREAFVQQGERIRKWEVPWRESVPRGPNAPGAIAPSFRKTLRNVVKETALSAVSTTERVASEGAVLTWALRGSRALTVYGETTAEYRDVKKALDAYFKIAAPKR